MKRYIVLFAAIVIHLCLGSVYAWSIFVPALRHEFGYSVAQTQLVFGLCFLMLTSSMVLVGRLQYRFGSRLPGMLSGVLFLLAYVTASAFADNFIILLLSMGLLCGIAVGLGYISALTTVTKLFPKHTGLASGLVVAGYGLGAIILSYIAEKFFAEGFSVEQIFRRVGLLYGAVIFVSGSLLAVPKQFRHTQAKLVRTKKTVKDKRFWAMATGMFSVSFAGLLIIGNLKSIGLEFGFKSTLAATSIGIMAIGNSSGRVLWGTIFDRYREKTTGIMLISVTISVMLVWILKGSFLSYGLAVGIMGLCYSGSFSIYPAQVGKSYGIESISKIYPLIILFHGLACIIAAPLGGLSFDVFDSYVPGLFLAVGVMAAGVAGHYILSKSSHKTIPDLYKTITAGATNTGE